MGKDLYPVPVLSIALRPKTSADGQRLDEAMRQLTAEDSTLSEQPGAEEGWTIIGATTEARLEEAIDRLKRVFHVSADCGRPQVGYKETFTRPAEGEARYVSRVPGRNRYAHVKIRVRPNDAGAGCVFENAILGGAIPAEFLGDVEEGIRHVLCEGVLAHHPVDDITVELCDGSFHDADSSSGAFSVAGVRAIRDAAAKARAVLLEPMMHADIAAPEEDVHGILFDLAGRHARVAAPATDRSGAVAIHAVAPLHYLLGFAADLRSRTSGRATCTIEYDGYQECETYPDGRDDDRSSGVREPRRPAPTAGRAAAAVPEPSDDDPTSAPSGPS